MTTPDSPFAVDGTERHWQVKPVPQRKWLKLIRRTLAEALVLAPDGTPYVVRISRNRLVRGSVLGPLDNFMPPPLSLVGLVATNVYARGRTGWTVRVIKPRTRWLPRQVMSKDGVKHTDDVADRAVAIAAEVSRGTKP